MHVWSAWLDGPLPSGAEAVLSPRERERAERFVFAHDAHRYRGARLMQRAILSAYTGIPAADIRFTTVARGRPELDPAHGVPGLSFNMSDSGGHGLMGIAVEGSIGVDVESPRDMPDAMDIAHRYFHPLERHEILSRPDAGHRMDGFFRCWTRKEAFMKAVGLGLYLPLESFAVGVEDERFPPLLHVGDDHGPAASWRLADLSHAPGVYAAIAIRAEIRRLETFSWQPGARQPPSAGTVSP